MTSEDFVVEALDLLKQKIKNGECTKQQTDAVGDFAVRYLDIFATADELAELYGKSKDAVHGVIKRKMLQKPKRNITLYNFNAFAKIVPSSWRKKH